MLAPRVHARTGTPAVPPKQILAIKCFGLGSIIQMVPMLSALKNASPDSRITLLTFTQNVSVAGLIPAVDEVVGVEFRRGLLVFLADTLRAVIALRRTRFDLIMDCEFFSYYVALLMHLVRGPDTVTVGFFNNRSNRDWLFTHLIAIDPSQHVSRLFFKMLSPLGITAECRPLAEYRLTVADAAVQRVRQLLGGMGAGSGDPLIVVNMNASELCPHRRWPVGHFDALIRMIMASAEYGKGAQVLLIGGPEDELGVGEFVERLSLARVHSLAGCIGIEELAALLKETALFAGNDSGPLHLAVACGTPTVSIFGPETPHLYGPQGGKDRVFYLERHCSPCLNLFYSKTTNCSDNACVREIAPEAVFAAVDELLREREFAARAKE